MFVGLRSDCFEVVGTPVCGAVYLMTRMLGIRIDAVFSWCGVIRLDEAAEQLAISARLALKARGLSDGDEREISNTMEDHDGERGVNDEAAFHWILHRSDDDGDMGTSIATAACWAEERSTWANENGDMPPQGEEKASFAAEASPERYSGGAPSQLATGHSYQRGPRSSFGLEVRPPNPPTHSLTHPPTHSLTHPPTHSLTHLPPVTNEILHSPNIINWFRLPCCYMDLSHPSLVQYNSVLTSPLFVSYHGLCVCL